MKPIRLIAFKDKYPPWHQGHIPQNVVGQAVEDCVNWLLVVLIMGAVFAIGTW